MDCAVRIRHGEPGDFRCRDEAGLEPHRRTTDRRRPSDLREGEALHAARLPPRWAGVLGPSHRGPVLAAIRAGWRYIRSAATRLSAGTDRPRTPEWLHVEGRTRWIHQRRRVRDRVRVRGPPNE